MQIWALILGTMRETIEKKIFWINLLLSAAVIAALACVSFNERGVELFFGWRTFEKLGFTTEHPFYRGLISTVLSGLFVDYYIGWVACILGLVSTAGVFPSLIEKGSIDAIVARPMSRWTIFLAKYAGCLFYMLVQATFFIVLLFLIVGWRWHAWFPGLLWSIPLLVLLFSYLYCICVAFGLWTRSGIESLLLTLAMWMIPITGIHYGYEITHSTLGLKDWHKIQSATATLRWVVPNTTGVARMVQRAMDDTDPMEMIEREARQGVFLPRAELEYALEFEKKMIAKPWYYWVGPSLAFEAVVLLLTGWRFSRKDF